MNTKINIRPLDIRCLDSVIEMASESYFLERTSAKGLSEGVSKDFFKRELEKLLLNGTGRIAFESDTPIGFLAFSKIYEIRPGIEGATSPLWGYGIRHDRRGEIVGRLFQDIAAELASDMVFNDDRYVFFPDVEPALAHLSESGMVLGILSDTWPSLEGVFRLSI